MRWNRRQVCHFDTFRYGSVQQTLRYSPFNYQNVEGEIGPIVEGFLLQEDGFFLLQEDGSKIIILA